ncbi:Hypothetical predicted protein [Xyrichtys novacula]|uniref:Uncharacterized protein n=1 Tax=Xyrichtys novacula TaxID=13765 RepID=A0AAV1FF06_XYRNO|nr:Hypothetical predicted protein [Xyrichtys novacula]
MELSRNKTKPRLHTNHLCPGCRAGTSLCEAPTTGRQIPDPAARSRDDHRKNNNNNSPIIQNTTHNSESAHKDLTNREKNTQSFRHERKASEIFHRSKKFKEERRETTSQRKKFKKD